MDTKTKAVRDGVEAETRAAMYDAGRITGHGSDPDGYPDIGYSVGLGGGRMLWVGEISKRLFAESGASGSDVGGSGGTWLIVYGQERGETHVLGKAIDGLDANALCCAVSAAFAAPSAAGGGEIRGEASFLMDRLEEFFHDNLDGDCTTEALRDWLGHIDPSISRLKNLLSSPSQGSDTGEAGRETFETIAQWCEETFGPIAPERIASRAAEEMAELRADPTRVEEAADVVIVLSRYPGLWDAVQRKMAVNRARTWRLMGDGTGYHVPLPLTGENQDRLIITDPGSVRGNGAVRQDGQAHNLLGNRLFALIEGTSTSAPLAPADREVISDVMLDAFFEGEAKPWTFYAAHLQPHEKDIWRRRIARVLALAHPGSVAPTSGERGINALADAFRAADAEDWRRLFLMLDDSGHGRFWQERLRAALAALNAAPPPASRNEGERP